MLLDNSKIMLVDDDEIVNKLNHYLISELNLFSDIIIQSNPHSAIEYLENLIEENQQLPAFVLVDISMPEMDGFEFIDQIDELFDEMDVIEIPTFFLLTASNFRRDIEQFEKTPIVKQFLTKPLQKEELLQAINLQ
jgi:CheY-like chemotaxis protein